MRINIKENVIFIPISNPRLGNGFGQHKCTKCGSNSTAFLGIIVGKYYIELCKSCLNKGECIINNTILSKI